MKKQKLDDKEYIEGFRNKDSYVIDLFYEENFHIVKHYIFKRSGIFSDVEDVMQDGIMFLIINLNKKGGKPNYRLGKYFMGICKHVWSRKLMIRKKSFDAELEASKLILLQDNELESLQHVHQMTLYSNSFKLLSPICQELIKNRHNKKPYKEIVEELDLKSVENARQRKHYCQEKLISIIKNRKEY